TVIGHNPRDLSALRLSPRWNMAADRSDVGEIGSRREIAREFLERPTDRPLHTARPGDGRAILRQGRYLLVPEVQADDTIAPTDQRSVPQSYFARSLRDVDAKDAIRMMGIFKH